MRELCLAELSLVSGGIGPEDFKDYKPSKGIRAAGAAINIVTNRFPLKGAFVVGTMIGEGINRYTPVQSVISKGLDKITSKAGDNYSDGSDY